MWLSHCYWASAHIDIKEKKLRWNIWEVKFKIITKLSCGELLLHLLCIHTFAGYLSQLRSHLDELIFLYYDNKFVVWLNLKSFHVWSFQFAMNEIPRIFEFFMSIKLILRCALYLNIRWCELPGWTKKHLLWTDECVAKPTFVQSFIATSVEKKLRVQNRIKCDVLKALTPLMNDSWGASEWCPSGIYRSEDIPSHSQWK